MALYPVHLLPFNIVHYLCDAFVPVYTTGSIYYLFPSIYSLHCIASHRIALYCDALHWVASPIIYCIRLFRHNFHCLIDTITFYVYVCDYDYIYYNIFFFMSVTDGNHLKWLRAYCSPCIHNCSVVQSASV